MRMQWGLGGEAFHANPIPCSPQHAWSSATDTVKPKMHIPFQKMFLPIPARPSGLQNVTIILVCIWGRRRVVQSFCSSGLPPGGSTILRRGCHVLLVHEQDLTFHAELLELCFPYRFGGLACGLNMILFRRESCPTPSCPSGEQNTHTFYQT